MLKEDLFRSWVAKESRSFLAKKRRYPHFDPKIPFTKNITFFRNYFNKGSNVSKHSFYPFIKMILETPRYKKVELKQGEQFLSGNKKRVMDKKERPISYAAHFDAFIYSYYSTLLSSRYEKKIKKWEIFDNVLAYVEKGASNIHFAHEVFEFIKNKGECIALTYDISSFFDGLEHEHLRKMWGRVINKPKLPDDHFKVFQSLTKYTYVEKFDLEKEFTFLKDFSKKGVPIQKICEPFEFRDRVRKKGLIKKNENQITLKNSPRFNQPCGIPQGSPLSACLSNIYMIEFDIRIKQEVDKSEGLYRRYSDDIIIVVSPEYYKSINDFVLAEIESFHLEINEKKSEITFFKMDKNSIFRGFDENDNYSTLQYLGFEFNGQNTYIRSSSMSRYHSRISSRIRENLKAAYGKNSIGDSVFKKSLYNRYTEKGERNFITYAERAMNIMNSETIYKQYKNSVLKVKNKFLKKKKKHEENLANKGTLDKVMK